jgi:hypothetical protein
MISTPEALQSCSNLASEDLMQDMDGQQEAMACSDLSLVIGRYRIVGDSDISLPIR